MNHVGQGPAAGLLPALLLGGGVAEHHHGGGEHIVRQVEQLPVGLALLHHVPDVAGADAQAPGSGNGVLGGDVGIGAGQQQVSHPRLPGLAAASVKGVVPLLTVGAENQHQRRLGDKGLVVTGLRQGIFQLLIGNVQNGVQLLVARCGGGAGGLQDGPLVVGGNGLFQIGPHRFAVPKLMQNVIH